MFDRHETGGGAAVLVQVLLRADDTSAEEDLREFKELAASTGTKCKAIITSSRQKPEPKYFIGSGKAKEIADVVRSTSADLVIFNHALTPSQERNLEKLLECRVLDRTGLILDIFARRARSHEGKLQVELAQLRYLSTRLVRGWSHLERQKGGIGLRGPGEKQLETDRRLLAARIKTINNRLEKVNLQRDQGRQLRKKADIATISLVGYTNAGKSTLFNALCNSEAYVADQLFATLDPTLRRLQLSPQESVVLADTVGFIRQLPHDLVAAFRATLQETREADVLLHVVDVSDSRKIANIDQVNAVLAEVGADKVPQILVYNKIDLENGAAKIEKSTVDEQLKVWVSAVEKTGLDELKRAISEVLSSDFVTGQLQLPMDRAKLRAKLFSSGAVLTEKIVDDSAWVLDIRVRKTLMHQLQKKFPEINDYFSTS